MTAFALTIFTGAFLLFQVQPLMGKFILPWFGGGPGVWTTCMLFFQVLLLGGYAYAHWLTTRTRARTQAVVHLALATVALALLPIIPGEAWKPQPNGQPTLQILELLGVCVGLPYFVLSATGPLLQRWFSRSYPGRSPYRLFALSNAGCLLALVSYPFVFEPYITRKAQAGLWGWGLLLYAACCGLCARRLWRSGNLAEAPREELSEAPPPGRMQRALWLALPACASALLLAVTNKLCQDVAVIPFLWIAPLSLYLFSFILCFEHQRWYRRTPFALALVVAMTGLCLALIQGSNWPVWVQISVYCAALFVCCMVCHGELYRLRPAPARLTSFYLGIAAGGALGGVFVALAAPLLFVDYYELHWGLFASAALFVLLCWKDQGSPVMSESADEAEAASAAAVRGWRWLACTLPLLAAGGLDWCLAHPGSAGGHVPKSLFTAARILLWSFVAVLAVSWLLRRHSAPFKYWRVLACLWLTVGLGILGFTLGGVAYSPNPDCVHRSRNFYGVLTVYEHRRDDPQARHFLLQHGRITHGLQFTDPEEASWPTTYYAPESGIGLAMNAELPHARRIGVVGLGTGSLAAFAKPGDYLRFYEINP